MLNIPLGANNIVVGGRHRHSGSVNPTLVTWLLRSRGEGGSEGRREGGREGVREGGKKERRKEGGKEGEREEREGKRVL